MKQKCLVVNCYRIGRKLGTFVGKDLIYCHKHEDYANRVINFLINSRFRYKLTKFLGECRQDILMKNQPKLCINCNKLILEYVEKKIKEIGEIEK